MRIAARDSLLLLLLLYVPTAADDQSSGSAVLRDYTYYPGDFVNPLLSQPLYYKDAPNVLADLDSFQSIYILYHSCAYVRIIVC